jgi:hypothetical protein
VVQLPQEFSWTSFSTSAVAGGTNYSILFTTRITPGPPVPTAATGYRIDSISIAGTKPDGAAFSLAPTVGESGSRVIWTGGVGSVTFSPPRLASCAV